MCCVVTEAALILSIKLPPGEPREHVFFNICLVTVVIVVTVFHLFCWEYQMNELFFCVCLVVRQPHQTYFRNDHIILNIKLNCYHCYNVDAVCVREIKCMIICGYFFIIY